MGPPELLAVRVSPRSPVVSVHDSLAFSALVHRTDGQDVALPVFWIASAGNISADGGYTPPDSAGEFQIIAAVKGQNLIDTVHVTVLPDTTTPPDSTSTPPDSTGTPVDTTNAPTPPPPPPPSDSTITPLPGPYPNEPQGMTPISERGFDATVENSWTARGNNYFSIVQDAFAPHSPPNIGQARFSPGLAPGTGPIQTVLAPLGNARTLYVAFWMKLSSNWFGGSNAVNKILFNNIGAEPLSGKAVIAAVGIGNAPLELQMRVQGMNVASGRGAAGGAWNAGANLNHAAATIVRGRWQFYEYVLVANTPGQLDGEIHFWLDGVKVGQYTSNVGWSSALETGADNVWKMVKWNPTWGGSGPTVPADQYMWIDHIYVSGKQ